MISRSCSRRVYRQIEWPPATFIVVPPPFSDIGLKNIDDAGFSPFVRFFREPSAKGLSRLQDEAVVLDFICIDFTKIFDILQTDVFYCTKLLRKGGLLVLDDCGIPGPHKLARYLLMSLTGGFAPAMARAL